MLVRFYRTVSPLLYLVTQAIAVYFLWHYPARRRDSRFVSTCPVEPRLSSPPVAKRCDHPVDSPSANSLTQLLSANKRQSRYRGRVASPRGDRVRYGRAGLRVGEFYQLLTAHLEAGFGRRRPHWVRGEIAKVYEKGHVYVDLVDAGATVIPSGQC